MKIFILLLALGTAVSHVRKFQLSDAIGDFGLRVLKEAIKSTSSNLVFSPYSIHTAIGLCLFGSEGRTRTAIKDTLGLNEVSDRVIESGYSATISELERTEKSNGFKVKLASRLCVNESIPFLGSYQRKIHEVFRTDVEAVDFLNRAHFIKEQINTFVERTTNGSIPNLLTLELPKDSLMVLINALYFEGAWKSPMSRHESNDGFNDFPGGANQRANWIKTTDYMNYVQSEPLESTLLEVPYASPKRSSRKASMLFILPPEGQKTDLRGWIKSRNFTWKQISNSIKLMKKTRVELILPKFKFESRQDIAHIAATLGMSAAFTPKANFSGMVSGGSTNFHLSSILHAAKIAVAENGTEASAGTVTTISLMSLPLIGRHPIKLIFNRTFLAVLILRHEQRIVPLFVAMVAKL